MSKFFRSLKQSKKVQPTAPRTMEELNKEYSILIGKVGQAQYQVYAYTREVERLNQELLNVNLESKSRSELDAKAAQEAKAQTEKEATNGEAV